MQLGLDFFTALLGHRGELPDVLLINSTNMCVHYVPGTVMVVKGYCEESTQKSLRSGTSVSIGQD